MKRIGEVIKIRPECLEDYKTHHANPWPGINEMIKECNIQNYSIYQWGDYMFAYYEYVGDDFEADMKKMEEDLVSQRWEVLMRSMMIPMEDRKEGEFWAGMTEVYHLD